MTKSSCDLLPNNGSTMATEGVALLAPVFLIGVHRRCGSNFVCDALRLHSDFAIPEPISEDYLLEHADLIRAYVERTAEARWKKRFRVDSEFEAFRDDIYRQIGDGLTSVLRERVDGGRRLLTKTPDPDNVEMFFSLFPDAKLVFIVRDGRDVVESSYRSWPSESYSHWMRMWARGARIILDFAKGPGMKHRDRWRLVRYEDLLGDRQVFSSLLDFLDVPEQSFPWDELDQLPVRGSSTYRGGRAELHWEPVARPKDFRPTGRWSSWGRLRRWQFRRLAGREQLELGYSLFD